MTQQRKLGAGLALGGAVVLSALIRTWVNRRFEGPQILCDEFIYAGAARDFATTGHLAVAGGPAAGGSLLYSALIAPAWLAHSMATTYGLLKGINAVLISLTAVPVYLWARRLVSPAWALLAACLSLLLTALVLSGMVMSENASLPAFTLALFAVALALERPTLPRQALVLVTVAVAYEARTQGLVMLAVVPTALLFQLLLDVRAGLGRREAVRRVQAFAPLAAVVVAAVLAYLAYNGFSPGRAVGFYHRTATAHYHPPSVALWAARQAGEATLAIGVAPACAFLIVLLLAVRRGFPRVEDRAFVATASAALLWFFAQAGAYASVFNGWILERYSVYVFPPLLIGFVLWLARGLPRPRAESAVAVAVPLALACLVVFGPFLRPEQERGVFSTLTLHFYARVPVQVGDLTAARVVVFLLAVAAALVAVLAPPWFARPLLPLGVAMLLLVASHSAYGTLVAGSQQWFNATGPTRSWIDDAVGSKPGRSGFLYVANPTPEASGFVLANTEFWNRSLGSIYSFGARQVCPRRSQDLHVDDRSGQVVNAAGRAVDPDRYLVTDRGLAVAGRPVASGGPTTQPLAIYAPVRPLRLSSQVTGVYADGWTGADATYFQYWAPKRRPGVIDVTLSRVGWNGPDAPGTATVTVQSLRAAAAAAAERRTWVAHTGGSTSFRLAAPPPPFSVNVHVAPTFTPSRFGFADTRELGVQATFTYHGGA